MKKICVLILLAVLALPSVAQAYYFDVVDYSFYPSDAASGYWDTYGDQVDFVANAAAQGNFLVGNGSTKFSLYSDSGRDIVTSVEAALTDIFNSTTSDRAFYNSSFTLYAVEGETSTEILTGGNNGTTTLMGVLAQASGLTYYDLLLTTGVTYLLEFSFTVNATAWQSYSQTYSLDVNVEEAPTPIPGAVWLLGTGLAGLLGLRRKLSA